MGHTTAIIQKLIDKREYPTCERAVMHVHSIMICAPYVVSLQKSGAEGPKDSSIPATDEVAHAQDDELNRGLATHRLGRDGRLRFSFVILRCNDLESVDSNFIGILGGWIDGYGTFLESRVDGSWRSLLVNGEGGRAGHGGTGRIQ